VMDAETEANYPAPDPFSAAIALLDATRKAGAPRCAI